MKKFKNKKILLSFIIVFLIGLAFGISFIFYINEINRELISNEITKYINSINENISYFNGFLNSFKINFAYITIAWTVGIIPFLFLINYFIIFYKGFLIGFIISTFVMIYKLKGIIISLIFLFPHEFLNVFLLITLSVISIKFSKKTYLKLFKSKYNNEYDFNFEYKEYIKKYFIFIFLAILSSLLEIFFNSLLMRLVV